MTYKDEQKAAKAYLAERRYFLLMAPSRRELLKRVVRPSRAAKGAFGGSHRVAVDLGPSTKRDNPGRHLHPRKQFYFKRGPQELAMLNRRAAACGALADAL